MRRDSGHPLLAATLDLAMAPLARLRPPVVREARGRVLELGVGTGANLAHYDENVELVGIEPDPHMLRRARQRAEELGREVELIQAGAEALPFPDDGFEAAVVTWVFCTIPDPEAAIRELRRVLRPGATVHYVEHVASPLGAVRAVQGLIDPAWAVVAGGCRLTREPTKMLRSAGFSITEERRHGASWSPFPLRSGTARLDR